VLQCEHYGEKGKIFYVIVAIFFWCNMIFMMG
jgi:hypothetical protein